MASLRCNTRTISECRRNLLKTRAKSVRCLSGSAPEKGLAVVENEPEAAQSNEEAMSSECFACIDKVMYCLGFVLDLFGF
jgi:hypothetical protein